MQHENRKNRVLRVSLALLLCLMLAAGTLLPTLAATGKVKTLKVSAATQSTITLKWTTVKDATRYQLQQYKDKHWTQIASTAKNTYKVKQLSAGATYKFRVRALKEKQKGAFSETLKARTAPARVENVLVKSAKPTSVQLQWSKVKGAEGYRVQRYVNKTWVTVAKTEKRSVTIKNLPKNTVLSFRVAAFLKSGSKTVFGKNSAVCKAKTALTPEKQQASLYKKYEQIFQSGTFLMTFTTNDPDLGNTPITFAMKNGNVAVDTKMLGYQAKILYLAKTDQTYLLIPAFKRYTLLPDSVQDELDYRNIGENFSVPADAASATVSSVQKDGKQYTVETFRGPDEEVRYYFSAETLVQIDVIEADGTVSSTYIQTVTQNVPDSLFEIPSRYRFMNLSFLEQLGA